MSTAKNQTTLEGNSVPPVKKGKNRKNSKLAATGPPVPQSSAKSGETCCKNLECANKDVNKKGVTVNRYKKKNYLKAK